MQTIAISACLLGESCRYDGSDNLNVSLLTLLKGKKLIPFCPEAHAFGTPRPTMDLIQTPKGNKVFSNETGLDLSPPIVTYADDFFNQHEDISLFIGKDRSPSCGVCSAKLYTQEKQLVSTEASGLMAKVAQKRGILCKDAEQYLEDKGRLE